MSALIFPAARWTAGTPSPRCSGLRRGSLHTGLLAALALLVPALGAGIAAESPQIAFASTTFDFKRVAAGEVVRHEFIFTNTGTAVLEVTDVRPGCGCTTSGTWDRRVEPGKTGVIPLQFNSTGFSGSVSKPATVSCNDPARPSLTLSIQGHVWKPIEITPSTVMFRAPEGTSTNLIQVVRIVNNMDEPLTLTDIENTNRAFQAELTAVRPGQEFELRVTALAPFTTAAVNSTIRVKSSAPGFPFLTIGVYAYVQANVLVSPERLGIPSSILSNGVTRSVMIRNQGTNRLSISEPRTTVRGAEVTIDEVDPGKLYSLRVKFPVGTSVPTDGSAFVSVKTSDPRKPVIQIPVTAIPAVGTGTPVRTTPPAGPGIGPKGRPTPQPAPDGGKQ